MTPQNKELERLNKYIQEWNKRRELAEKKGLERFYELRELFNEQKKENKKLKP